MLLGADSSEAGWASRPRPGAPSLQPGAEPGQVRGAASLLASSWPRTRAEMGKLAALVRWLAPGARPAPELLGTMVYKPAKPNPCWPGAA